MNNIALISGIKTGTWLTRRILSLMTKMDFFEPEIIPGENKYFNAEQLKFKENTFYSWHIIPTNEVVNKLNENNTKTIFVIRNIYDLVISIYYHFYNNIDSDIGRGNNKDKFLKQFTFDEGISLIITGFDENNLRWNGMSEIIINCNEILKASKNCESIVLNYEDLVQNKKENIEKISNFLNINLSNKELSDIEEKSSFNAMKEKAKKEEVGSSHFREGNKSKNRTLLKEFHKVQIRQIIKKSAPDLYDNAKELGFEDILYYE
ncbi:hypothetical protein CRU98_10670 [Arcobacter sp. CECT 8986]|uniref:sulfotransferase domain-containing protein n=1 Tax=Arcobacter sp. CECT 8986 TaxID=2044507 RepID=UPI001009D1D9|nr:sulfotransferase domain-containing protein [Arcobacter sp. CECT 8986]RXJ98216.1 hypothetical protein CRU98_10670 [Arcobacter sp. CECT 8986]